MTKDVVKKEQRIRDPVHEVVVFSGSDDFEKLIWDLLNASEFTAEALPNAIQKLFELNHYDVEGPVQ